MKKNDIMKSIGKWMQLEKKITVSKVVQTQKDKYNRNSLILDIIY